MPKGTALVTGSAGFIGFHVCRALLADGWCVIGLDSFSDYYDLALKEARLAELPEGANFTQIKGAVETPGLLDQAFAEHRADLVVHLAAQAGVRHSIDAPRDYVQANLVGTLELLEAARAYPPKHLMLASTSSAYGANRQMPYEETQRSDWPVSFYAATKKANEAMAHSYAHLYRLPITMFRFFTVYGPWGRPDMAPYKFTRAIFEDRPIDVYNHGDMARDFTYIDDLVSGILALGSCVPPQADARETEPVPGDSLSPVAPWRVVNIGNGEAVPLLRFIEAIEAATGKQATKNWMPMQPGDVQATWSSDALLTALIGPRQRTQVDLGIQRFVTWFRDYYGF